MFLKIQIPSQIIYKQSLKYLHSGNVLRPRRACMYVPGDDERKIKKAFQTDVDSVVLDCEDGVAQSKKIVARDIIRNLFDTKGSSLLSSRTEWAVRTNSVDSGFCKEDINTLFSGPIPPETLFLPKLENTEQLKWVSEQLQHCLHEKNKNINLVFYIESARALLNMVDICKEATKLTSLNPVAIVFGSDDFCADIGVIRTEEAVEILYARQKILSIAKAFKLQAIDMGYIRFKDLDGLKQQCEEGVRMGYTGKQIIHPMQVNIVQETFLPSTEKLVWAHNLLEAFKEHQKVGKGAFVFNGSMIDMPTMKQAQNIINLMEMIKK